MSNSEEIISKELDTRIKLTKKQTQKIYKTILKNLLIAILVLVYFCFLNLGYLRLDHEVFKTDLKVFAISLVICTIIAFELAYKRDSIEATLYGIELLFLSILTLNMPYVYFYESKFAKIIFIGASLYITIYYLIKSVFIYFLEKKKIIHKYSDIKDIIKTEKISHLDEQNKRKFSKKEKQEKIEPDDKKEVKAKKKKTKVKNKKTTKKSKKKGDSND